ncbi:uncharacterized protein LOC135182769 isoform X2 [Pogoniulus pusillus]|uniref:uncharacterized protein LOC135182769 isoform X2 n=1 Tax=Pogoniulus pusillus TaxID=488313 RepID=UPI0030B92F43
MPKLPALCSSPQPGNPCQHPYTCGTQHQRWRNGQTRTHRIHSRVLSRGDRGRSQAAGKVSLDPAPPGITHPCYISDGQVPAAQPITTFIPGSSQADTAMSRSSVRSSESIQFLWFKSLPGYGKLFYAVSEREIQPGDIVLVPIEDWRHLDFLFKHAAVYLGDGEVIHFQGRGDKNGVGVASKQGFEAMKKERGKYKIYRKRGGIDLDEFQSRVKEAMNSEAKYHTVYNNCIHFALWLLGLGNFYQELVEISREDGKEEAMASTSVRQYETTKFLLHKRTPGHGEVFDVVPEGEVQPGDILLFPTEDSGSLGSFFRHAAVYRGDGDVIHFQGMAGKRDSGRVTMEDLEAMRRERGEWRIYRKRGGIDRGDFRRKVREAVNRDSSADLPYNNCIHFALWLLGLDNLYLQLVEIPNEDAEEGCEYDPHQLSIWYPWKGSEDITGNLHQFLAQMELTHTRPHPDIAGAMYHDPMVWQWLLHSEDDQP